MNKRLKSIRNRLYSESPLCRECGVQTFLPIPGNPKIESTYATIQHIRLKNDPLYNDDITLFCHECNKNEGTERNHGLHPKNCGLIKDKNVLDFFIDKKYGIYELNGSVYKCSIKKKDIRKIVKLNDDYIDYKFLILKEYLSKKIDNPSSIFPIFDIYFKNHMTGKRNLNKIK